MNHVPPQYNLPSMDVTWQLRAKCGHDSRTVPGCTNCEAADTIEALRDALAEAEKAEPVARVVEVGDTTTPEGRLATIIAEALGVDHPAMTDLTTILLQRAHPPEALPESFAQWVRKNIPPGTVISDPEWWIPRLYAAARGKG